MLAPRFHHRTAKSVVRPGSPWLLPVMLAFAVSGCGFYDGISRLQSGQAVTVSPQKPLVGEGQSAIVAIDVDAPEQDRLIAMAVGTKGEVVADDAVEAGHDRWVTISVSKFDLWKNNPAAVRHQQIAADLHRGVMVTVKVRRGDLRPLVIPPGESKPDQWPDAGSVDFSGYITE